MSVISEQFGGPMTSTAGQLSSSDSGIETGQGFPKQRPVTHLLAHMDETKGSIGGDTAWVSDPSKVYGISSATIKSPLMAGIGNQ